MKIEGFELAVRNVARYVGIDIRRYRPKNTDLGRLALMLADQKVDLVFDVGANTGQFAKTLRAMGYQGRLVSFEPLTDAHAQLSHASRHDTEWIIAPRGAIGDQDAEINIHVSGNSVSSSALNMLDSHAAAAPESSYIGIERVQQSRLDTVAEQYMESGNTAFIKIDTQGYEDRVLDGATTLLPRVTGMQLELSFVPLYEGQKLFSDLVERLRSLGFSIWSIFPGFFEPRTGRMLQVDVTFFRERS
ncbi:FkbM family methyltransferase [Rhodanobacter sp. UC4437_H4]|jgi:FkbM family methyltransferase